ncbi:MAG: AsnC family transcriptional regulator [Candidatus Bathyarchaeota archaeon]|nr:AsnC family transcriptional regulator [Candidatus Bathyarchaeota archaeon]
MFLDDLDKQIIQHLSIGTSSYEELARQCNVTRNTIYRRIAALEKNGIIKNILRCTVDLSKINLTAIMIGITIPQFNLEQAKNRLAANRNVKWLWKTYGTHNLTLVAFCDKGNEGETIQNIKGTLEELNAEQVCISVGFAWEKMSYSPFPEQMEMETGLAQMLRPQQELKDV